MFFTLPGRVSGELGKHSGTLNLERVYGPNRVLRYADMSVSNVVVTHSDPNTLAVVMASTPGYD